MYLESKDYIEYLIGGLNAIVLDSLSNKKQLTTVETAFYSRGIERALETLRLISNNVVVESEKIVLETKNLTDQEIRDITSFIRIGV